MNVSPTAGRAFVAFARGVVGGRWHSRCLRRWVSDRWNSQPPASDGATDTTGESELAVQRNLHRPIGRHMTVDRTVIASSLLLLMVSGSGAAGRETSERCVAVGHDTDSPGARMTSAEQRTLLSDRVKGFTSEAVRGYVLESLRPERSPMEHRVPPREYEDLVGMGSIAVPPLLELLETGDAPLRTGALMALIEITNKRLGSYGDSLGDGAGEREARTAAVLKWKDWWRTSGTRPRLEWLLDDLKGGAPEARRSAAMELGHIGDRAAISGLKSALGGGELDFYVTASLAKLGDRSAIPYLFDLYLSHENVGYRHEGIALLKTLTGTTEGVVSVGW